MCVATFLFPDEAAVACGAAHSAGIPCYLDNERIVTAVWAWNYAVGGIRLMVPDEWLESARLIFVPTDFSKIEPVFSDTDGSVMRGRYPFRVSARICFALCCIFSPVITSLSLVYCKHC